jgi:hypothetical protein
MLERARFELERVRSKLEIYKKQYRKARLPALELSGIYALFPDRLGPADEVKHKWDDTWPFSSRSGVYFIFADSGEIVYIGTAWNIGVRLGKYFHYDVDRKCKIVGTWIERPAYLATLAVPEEMSFEAAGLEEYFIDRLNPRLNKIGRLEDDPSEPKLR